MRSALTHIDRTMARYLDRRSPLRDAFWLLSTWCVCIALMIAVACL